MANAITCLRASHSLGSPSSPVSGLWSVIVGPRCQKLKLHAGLVGLSGSRREVVSSHIAESVLLVGKILLEVAGYAIRKIIINHNSGQ